MAELTIKIRGFRLPKFLKSTRFLIIVIIILGLGTVGTLKYLSRNNTPPLTRNTYQGLPFIVYYPPKLPSGYKIVTNSAENLNHIALHYHIVHGSKDILVQEEVLLPATTLTQLYSARLKDSHNIRTTIGDGVTGQFYINDNRHVASISAPGTWVTIFGPPDMPYEDLITVASSLRPLLSSQTSQ